MHVRAERRRRVAIIRGSESVALDCAGPPAGHPSCVSQISTQPSPARPCSCPARRGRRCMRTATRCGATPPYKRCWSAPATSGRRVRTRQGHLRVRGGPGGFCGQGSVAVQWGVAGLGLPLCRFDSEQRSMSTCAAAIGQGVDPRRSRGDGGQTTSPTPAPHPAQAAASTCAPPAR